MLTEVQVLGTLNLGTVLCLFLEAGPSYNLWQILDFLHGKGMHREKVCVEFLGKKKLLDRFIFLKAVTWCGGLNEEALHRLIYMDA